MLSHLMQPMERRCSVHRLYVHTYEACTHMTYFSQASDTATRTSHTTLTRTSHTTPTRTSHVTLTRTSHVTPTSPPPDPPVRPAPASALTRGFGRRRTGCAALGRLCVARKRPAVGGRRRRRSAGSMEASCGRVSSAAELVGW